MFSSRELHAQIVTLRSTTDGNTQTEFDVARVRPWCPSGTIEATCHDWRFYQRLIFYVTQTLPGHQAWESRLTGRSAKER